MISLFLTAGAICSPAAGQGLPEGLPACYTTSQCVSEGSIVPCALVPDTKLAKCEQYKADLIKEQTLHTRTLNDAKTLRTAKDQCIGDLRNEQLDVKTCKAELHNKDVDLQEAMAEIPLKVPLVLRIGLNIAAVAFASTATGCLASEDCPNELAAGMAGAGMGTLVARIILELL